MKDENYDYLKEQVKMTGFGETLQEQLKSKMQTGEPEFQLQHQIRYGEKEMSYALNFKKSATQDNYFFNSFDAQLKKPGEPDTLSNRFYTDQRITAKESFNLLEGRSVDKKYNHHEKVTENGKEVYRPIKDSTYNVWVKLDFNDADSSGNFKMKTYGDKWGFDLEQKINALPIKQLLNNEERTDLLNSLKKGNLQSVSFDVKGQNEPRYVEANPKGRTINVYDTNLIPAQEKSVLKSVEPEKKEKTALKQSEKQKGSDEEKDPKKAAKKKSMKA